MLLSVLAASPRARATDCEPASGVSTCFDANNLWLSAGPSRFSSIAAAEPLPRHTLAFAAFGSYLDRPVLLSAPSPDPEGREIAVVRRTVDLSLAHAYGVTSSLEVSLASAMVLYQAGSGAEGITSQSAPPLASAAVRDPRVGVGYAIPFPVPGAHLKSRLELGLPLGDAHLYAGAGAFTLAPSLALGLRRGPFHAASEVGVRLRRAVPFASARIGSQLSTAVGAGVDVLGELLSVEAEAFMLPSLVSQPGRDSATSRVRDGVLVPAEWLASLRSVPTADPGLALSLGGGTGIPLSSELEESPDGETTRRFAGVTTPRFRLFFGARYQR